MAPAKKQPSIPRKEASKTPAAAAAKSPPRKFKPSPPKGPIFVEKKKKAPPKKKIRSRFTRAFTATIGAGFAWVLYVKDPDDDDKEGYLGRCKYLSSLRLQSYKPNEVSVQEVHDFLERTNISKMCMMRNIDGTNTTQPKSPNSTTASNVFIHFTQPGEDEEAKKAWVENILTLMNEIAKEHFDFKVEYKYFGDVTPTTATGELAPQPFAKYLTDYDVLQCVKDLFGTIPYEELAEDDDTVIAFFGEDRLEEGRKMIRRTLGRIQRQEQAETILSDEPL